MFKIKKFSLNYKIARLSENSICVCITKNITLQYL